ncbi:NUDIX domain-containing protein [Motilimonas pumila]|uniref:NUDIX domain-containing protein n=1 Tax=Motilimonas pumila TaxID=2303987 RepID=A0A418YBK8_9GAMM|nr:NUDIX hydrolase [Motilimonas pumila]RJG40306.1 NUDIX domain-containing protein [Motilimonas pumila]
MRLLRSTVHPDVAAEHGKILKRIAARAIVLKGQKILLMYTQRYQDYTLPGGGLDSSESPQQGLCRELMEETGATGIRNIQAFGMYEEYRPWYKPDHDTLHMLSYCYTCEIDDTLGAAKLEDYEVNNGMSAVWVDIHQAIAHNQATIASSNKKGLSVERETFLLQQIATERLPQTVLAV